MCRAHYCRWQKYRDPLAGGSYEYGYPDNLWAFSDRSGGEDACWLWTGAVHKTMGYGMIGAPNTNLAHRAMYEHLVGPIHEGLVLDHLCRVRHCVNPKHLEATTQQQNVFRGGAGGFQLTGRCRNGLHDVTDPANVHSDKYGRHCLPCMRARWAKKGAKRRKGGV